MSCKSNPKKIAAPTTAKLKRWAFRQSHTADQTKRLRFWRRAAWAARLPKTAHGFIRVHAGLQARLELALGL